MDYPRCRIYREFFRTLMADRDIRTRGSSYLFYYMTLCSYANFRSSYRRIEGISYLVKFSITGWKQHNTALNYNHPCLKDVGFFFFPVAAVHELISMDKCSEMDIVFDLGIHTIYNDRQVQGSELGPVVYFRNAIGNPLTNFSDLALRWGISKATVSRILNKLQDKEYLSLVSFTGRHGSIIYLCSYLSTMFNISDVIIDKEEIS